MKNNNRGLSLVELIIAVGMLTIVGAMIVSFVAITSRTYTNVSAESSVQEEAQLTLNQIKDLVIDANRAVAYGLEAPDPSNMKEFTKIDEVNTETSIVASWIADGVNEDYIKRVLVIYNEKSKIEIQPDGSKLTTYTYPIVKIVYDKAKKQIYYAEHIFPTPAGIDISSFGTTLLDTYLLSEYVTDFSVDLKDIKDSQVDFIINFSSSSQIGVGREYVVTPTINLRNKVIVSENLSEIYKNMPVEINSFVVGIDVLKDDVVIHGDSIQLGSTVVYTAKVSAQYGASVAYTWKLTGDDSGFKSTVSGSGEVTVPMNEPSRKLMLTATSVGDTTKTAMIPITISGELRPTNISISSSETPIMGNATDIRKIYTFTAKTTYTDGTTSIGEDVSWTSPTNLPEGAYTSVNSAGQMLLYLKANGGSREYKVTVRANELNIVGEIVSAQKIITPGDLTYVDPSTMTVVINPGSATMSRGESKELKTKVSDFTGKKKNLNYTWEILEAESTGFTGTGINSIGKVRLANSDSAGKNKTLIIDKDLNWSTEFTIKVKVTAHDDVAGEVQSDSFIASFKVLPVTLDITLKNATIRTWYHRANFSYNVSNVILEKNDWNNADFIFEFSGSGYQNWGDWHNMTFVDSDIPRNEATINRNAKTGVGDVSSWVSGGYMDTAYIKLSVKYLNNTVTSNRLKIEE